MYNMGALVAKKLVNWQSLQERLDLSAIYRLTYFYEQKEKEPRPCSYEKKYLEVHHSITKQVIIVNFSFLINSAQDQRLL